MAGTCGGSSAEPGNGGDAAYLFPRHPSEIDRLDVQHYALRAMLGANYLAPVERPARILDVGSGTGQWGHDLYAEFPDALVVGLDLVPGKPGPPRYRFVRADLLAGLPFADGQFDFVHQRLVGASAVPLKSWDAVLTDLVRVARPGGWIELVETWPTIEPAGPATWRLVELTRRLGSSLGLDDTGALLRSLDEHLSQAGAVRVQKRAADLPIGDWGGRVGSLMASNGRAGFSRLCEVFEAKFGFPAGECRELISEARYEWERYRSTCPVAIAFGQKPL